MLKKGKGFAVGDTTAACTKGLWLWGEPVASRSGGHRLLFLDTEGLNSTDAKAGTNYDVRVFTLARPAANPRPALCGPHS